MKIKKTLVMLIVHARWAYFHIHPDFVKFSISANGDVETHFQDVKTGEIHSNLKWID